MNIMWIARENYEDLKEFKERNMNKYSSTNEYHVDGT